MFTKPQGYRAGKAGYVSEFEQFMDKFLIEYPEVVENQRRGWYIFWDRKVDLEELEKSRKDSVPIKGDV